MSLVTSGHALRFFCNLLFWQGCCRLNFFIRSRRLPAQCIQGIVIIRKYLKYVLVYLFSFFSFTFFLIQICKLFIISYQLGIVALFLVYLSKPFKYIYISFIISIQLLTQLFSLIQFAILKKAILCYSVFCKCIVCKPLLLIMFSQFKSHPNILRVNCCHLF